MRACAAAHGSEVDDFTDLRHMPESAIQSSSPQGVKIHIRSDIIP